MSSKYRDAIRSVLLDFLRDIDVAYPTVIYDEEFAQGCCKLAIERGCPVDIAQSHEFQLALHGAVAIATMTYGHLENVTTRQYVCIYTIWQVLTSIIFPGTNRPHSSLIFFDDLTRTDASMVREFHPRFASGRAQMHPLLDLFADTLRRSYDHFLPTCANLVVSSSLDFVTGLIVDHDLQNARVHFFYHHPCHL